jgi:hypothetical protein
MGKLSLIFLIVLSVTTHQSLAKTFTEAELTTILQQNGFSNIRDWICLVDKESSFTTSKTNKNKNKSIDYGLFQINSKYWCGIGKAGGECKIDCNKFLDDDINDDIECVKLIYKTHKFTAWRGYEDKCKGKLNRKVPAPSKPKPKKVSAPAKPKTSKAAPTNKKPTQTKTKKKTRS